MSEITMYPRVIRVPSVDVCDGCGLASTEPLCSVPAFGDQRWCWACLLVFGAKLIAKLHEAEIEHSYDRYNNDSRGGY